MLVSLAFSTAVLGSIHMLIFVWLTAFKYKDNIRGYVPAGLTGLSILLLSSWILLIYLGLASRKFRSFSLAEGKYRSIAGSYILGGILGTPTAVVLCSLYSSAYITIFGYSLNKDIIFSLIGAILMMVLAIWVHIKFMNKKADNKSSEPILKTPVD